MKTPEKTDWLAHDEQQIWFERHRSVDADGLRFNQFQQFLNSTVYIYLKRFPKQQASIDVSNQEAVTSEDMPRKTEEESTFSRHEEMLLFQTFDIKNDQLLDRDEFGSMCSKWLHHVYQPNCALVIVDVQNDFIDGSFALINGPAGQDGLEVVPVINGLIEVWQQSPKSRTNIVYTQDWHPPDHIGFHANLHLRNHTLKDAPSDGTPNKLINDCHKTGTPTSKHSAELNGKENSGEDNNNFKYKKFNSKAKVFDTVLFDEGRVEQKLWPTHCIQNSWGAQLHPKLDQVPGAICIKKGTLSHVDAYSAFWDNMHLNETGLKQDLVDRKISHLFFCGLALDFCVAASALDAVKAGFVTFVIEDACRGIDCQQMEIRKRELQDHNAILVQSQNVIDYLKTHLHEDPGFGGKSLHRDLIKTVIFRQALVCSQ